MRLAPTLAATVLGAFLVSLVTGCASPQHHAASAGRGSQRLSPLPFSATAGNPVVFRGANAELLADGSPVLPLDGYDVYAHYADTAVIAAAVDRAEQTCMRGRGADLPDGFGSRYLPGRTPALAYYGVTTMAQAKEYGYRLPDLSAAGAGSPLSEQQMKAFSGATGCQNTAYTSLGMQQSDDAFGFVQDLRARALSATLADPALQAADAKWSACMSAAGYHYPDPLAPGHDKSTLGRGLPVPKGASLPPVSPYERTVAETDVTCKRKTGYLQTYVNVAATHQEALIAANQQQLQQVLAEWRLFLITARTYTGQGSRQ